MWQSMAATQTQAAIFLLSFSQMWQSMTATQTQSATFLLSFSQMWRSMAAIQTQAATFLLLFSQMWQSMTATQAQAAIFLLSFSQMWQFDAFIGFAGNLIPINPKHFYSYLSYCFFNNRSNSKNLPHLHQKAHSYGSFSISKIFICHILILFKRNMAKLVF